MSKRVCCVGENEKEAINIKVSADAGRLLPSSKHASVQLGVWLNLVTVPVGRPHSKGTAIYCAFVCVY